MKKLFFLVFFLFAVFGAYLFLEGKKPDSLPSFSSEKKPILKIGLVSDSHNENSLLETALLQIAQEKVDFVIGLGDYTNTGTTKELIDAKKVFDESNLKYYLIPGDREGWESREKGEINNLNFNSIFGRSSLNFSDSGVEFFLLDNSDIYNGLSLESLGLLDDLNLMVKCQTSNVKCQKLIFVFAHKTPFHPDSAHIMGEDSPKVATQAADFVSDLENSKVDGFFSGDLHFFAQFKSPNSSVRMTTIGAIASERNFQGPRFGILTVYSDYSWEVADIEII